MKKDILRTTKSRLAQMGIKIFQKDIAIIETIKRENVGHVMGWTKDTIQVTLKNGIRYTYIAEPTDIYSGAMSYKLVNSGRMILGNRGVKDMKNIKDMEIVKIDAKGNEYNYGKGYNDVREVVPKGYKFNGLFYEKKNTKTIYIVE